MDKIARELEAAYFNKMAAEFKIVDKLIDLENIYRRDLGSAEQKFQRAFEAMLVSANRLLRVLGYQLDVPRCTYYFRTRGSDGVQGEGELVLLDSQRRTAEQVQEDLGPVFDMGYGWRQTTPGVFTFQLGG